MATKKNKGKKKGKNLSFKGRKQEAYHDGYGDKLHPLKPIDVAKTKTVSALLEAYKDCSFGARNLGEAADVLEAMLRDKKCAVVITLSGAMTVAKMGLVLCEMIDRGWVQAVISTGALMAHGFVESTGRAHFKADPGMNDVELYHKGYDRVYDTYELEKNLDDVEFIIRDALQTLDHSRAYGSVHIHGELGKFLKRSGAKRAILKSAYEKNVPVYVPAFTDSELGLDISFYNEFRRREGKPLLKYDAFVDLEHYKNFVLSHERLGIFTIGGGVPRNWAQQVGPYIEILQHRMGIKLPRRQFHYGVRICPDPVYLGGLSGCTYSEGVSWGKFVPASHGGKFAEVFCDATIVWPLLVRAMIERI